jgi:hypothetical protein
MLEEVSIDAMIEQTTILEFLAQVFKQDEKAVERRQMKLEATWIALNLAMGSSNAIRKLSNEKFRIFEYIAM